MLNLKNLQPDIRKLNDMKKVIYDKEWLKTAPNLELYYMYRNLKRKKDLQYDVTIIPNIFLGKEFNKTFGHYNLGKAKELYIVLKGKAIFLIQKGDYRNLKDIYAIKAKKDEAIIVPAECGHIMINPGHEKLQTANWISIKGDRNYKPFEELNGAGYFYTKNGWFKNNNYKKIPKLRFEKPLKSIPKNLDFLR